MAPSWTYPPGPGRKRGRGARKPGRKLPGWTGNTLLTTVVSVVLSGVVAFLVAHYQSQDAVRQASVNQQIQEILKVEGDAASFYNVEVPVYESTLDKCLKPASMECELFLGTSADIHKLQELSDLLTADAVNLSDSKVIRAANNLSTNAYVLTSALEPQQLIHLQETIVDEFNDLLHRCGQIVQGKAKLCPGWPRDRF